ncbi:TAXI family TRAP transporter solute-binding subunit [Azospirillum sp. RWY-5-1]|uniref:TAXI family TRAP transporter solute-binding subunit n=2 Tax=Azospirillum oleiclasticum TaxID=2735135 RepID=A0ABX2TEF3_9PROT|nr:TAXI family TRAP transporter solute-binding subunit [Azospirillum oleiclasticum]NYZ22561.1 TAXI family TRAP transporter solute-binding subunit [Azospirillum oleiclasticum]
MRTPTLAALAVAAALGIAAPANAQTKLLIGATSASSSQYGYFVAVSQLINEKVPGVDSAVVETGATVDNLRRIARNQIDFGLVTTNVGFHAYAGEGDFKDRKVENVLLWVYAPAPQNVIVRADSGVTDIAGLAGKRFNPGLKGSATEKTAESVFKALGIAPDYVRGSTTDIVDAVKDNRAIGYVKSGAGNRLDGSTLDIATMTPVRVLSLTPEQQKTIATTFPDLSVVNVPAGAADGVPAYTTWSFGLAVHARPGLSDDLAYKIAKAAFEDTTVQAAALSEMKGADLIKLTIENGTVPLHPGVARYLKERGVTIPEKLQPKS